MMSRNINVSVSDEFSGRMEELKDVNWSAVTRECIEQYIKQRTAPGLEVLISKIRAERGEEFKNGFEFVIEKGVALGLAALEEIAHPKSALREPLGMLFVRLNRNLVDVDEILSYDENKEAGGVCNIRYKVSSDFVKGMQEAAKELLEKS